MRILYFTTEEADYLQDGILYGLKRKFGTDVVDFPKKEPLYKAIGNTDIYGKGFTLYGNLDDPEIDRSGIWTRLDTDEFDLTIFSSVYRQQLLLTNFRNYGVFKNSKTKWAFLDGEDDGFPFIIDATQYGPYFKRENPFGYKDIINIGLSIPACKMLDKSPVKVKNFTKHVQCKEAYALEEIKNNCTDEAVFALENQYYQDLSDSRFGITMKKSGWDVPRHMENAGHYVVNCIYNRAWDNTTWDDKPDVHPKGLVDMENCIVWDTVPELERKIHAIDFEKASEASRRWADNKTCEAMTEYFLNNI